MGNVYLLECINKDGITYKIGFTKGDIQNRVKALQVGNGYEIKELSSFSTKYDQKLESTLHKYFKHCRLKGEWFNLEQNDIDNFTEICKRIENNFNSLKDNPFFNNFITRY